MDRVFELARHLHRGRQQRSRVLNASRWDAAIGAICWIIFVSGASRADEFLSEYPTDFDGWQQQWHKESTSGTDGVATHTTQRGHLDGASLEFDMGDGFGDDGTLWIEKQFAITGGKPTEVQ
jgi:hypothetical protein